MNRRGARYPWVWAIVAVVLALGLGVPSAAVAQSGQPTLLAMGQWQGADSFHQVQRKTLGEPFPA